MPVNVLPDEFDDLISDAVARFWRTREAGGGRQEGSRGNVVSGKNLDGFGDVVRAVAAHVGLPSDTVFTSGKTNLTLPGYYRPSKNWDAVVIYRSRLLAAFEFKSIADSFGNNANNRFEEAVGNAFDFEMARRNGLFEAPELRGGLPNQLREHVRYEAGPPPFLGYLVVLEDCLETRIPRKNITGPFRGDRHFEDTSYSDRFQILCERSVETGLYGSAAVLLTERTGPVGSWKSHPRATQGTVRALFAEFGGRAAARREEG